MVGWDLRTTFISQRGSTSSSRRSIVTPKYVDRALAVRRDGLRLPVNNLLMVVIDSPVSRATWFLLHTLSTPFTTIRIWGISSVTTRGGWPGNFSHRIWEGSGPVAPGKNTSFIRLFSSTPTISGLLSSVIPLFYHYHDNESIWSNPLTHWRREG